VVQLAVDFFLLLDFVKYGRSYLEMSASSASVPYGILSMGKGPVMVRPLDYRGPLRQW